LGYSSGDFPLYPTFRWNDFSVVEHVTKKPFGITCYTKIDLVPPPMICCTKQNGGDLSMVHIQKFSHVYVVSLSNHIKRKTENHSNKEIDKERTHENYDLCEKECDMTSRYQERLDEVHCLNRADVKVMADWIVTLPEELNGAPEGSQKQFFEETYDF